jgi:hypothetical protein
MNSSTVIQICETLHHQHRQGRIGRQRRQGRLGRQHSKPIVVKADKEERRQGRLGRQHRKPIVVKADKEETNNINNISKQKKVN